MKQREASENVERSVSSRLKPSLLCEPNRFPDSGAILHLNRGVDQKICAPHRPPVFSSAEAYRLGNQESPLAVYLVRSVFLGD